MREPRQLVVSDVEISVADRAVAGNGGTKTQPESRSPVLPFTVVAPPTAHGPLRVPPHTAKGSASLCLRGQETQGVPWRRVRHKCAEPRQLAVARAPPSRRSVWNRTPPSPLRRHHPPMRCLSGLASVVTQNSLRVLHVDSCQPRPQVSLAPTAPRPSAALGAAQPSWMPPEERQLLWLPTGEHGPQP